MNNLKPGPEMDALIAERVMGLEPWPEQDPRWKVKAFRAPIIPFGVEPKPCQAPKFSTDISAAWMVVEKLTANNDRSFEMHKLMNLDENGHPMAGEGKYVAHFSRGLSQKADSAPMAICLAALSAVGK